LEWRWPRTTSTCPARPTLCRQRYAAGLITTPPTATYATPAEADAANLRMAVTSRDPSTIRMAMSSIQDPLSRKIALWALVDAGAESMSFFELDQARRDLSGWPRAQRRENAAEKALVTSPAWTPSG
jgi:soluble lytic murein transglycosylase